MTWAGRISDSRPEVDDAAGFDRLDATLEAPEGDWTGRVYFMRTIPWSFFAALSGSGTYEGWQYVASSIDEEDPDEHFDWTGMLYEGELPPYGPLSAPTSD